MIREKLKEGKTSLGGWMQLANTDVAEMMGDAGFDWVCIDMEHSPITRSDLPDLFRAITLGGTSPFCRIRLPEPDLAVEALEAGAEGIIVPNVVDAYQLREIKNMMHYAPKGFRGLGYCRGNMYGKYLKQHLLMNPLLVPMIENASAIPSLPYICREGIDALFIGSYDLSASIGKAGDFDCPEFKSAIDQIKYYAKEYNVPLGIHQVAPDRLEMLQKEEDGYQFIAYSADIVMIQTCLRDMLPSL